MSHLGASSSADKGKGKSPARPQPRRIPNPRRGIIIEDRSDDSYYAGDGSSPTEFGLRRVREEQEYSTPEYDFNQIASDAELAHRMAAEEAARAAAVQFPTDDPIDLDDDMDEAGDGGLGAGEPTETMPTVGGQLRGSDIFRTWFTKEIIKGKKGEPDVMKAKCNYCPKKYAWHKGSGYGTLKRHVATKHQPKDTGKQPVQTQLTKEGTSNLSLFKYNDIVAREVMAKFVATESLAFQFADSMRFENSMQSAYNPLATRISRSTMTRTILKLSLRYKKGLRDMFVRFPYRVSICSDIWTCAWQQNSYLGITVHWVDENWFLCKRILCFRKFNCAHTGTNIALCIIKVLQQFGLLKKIFSIGFDNASSNTASVPQLIAACNPTFQGKYFHTRCICHIFNLCVQDGLKMLEKSIHPIRKAVSMLRDKSKLHKAWVKFCKQRHGRSRTFNLDVCTRWNSTYEMLRDTYQYKEDLCAFFSVEVNNHILLESYWEDCNALTEMLEVFSNATKMLSGVYYPTSPRVLYQLVLCAVKFEECSHIRDLANMTDMMIMKWMKYFTVIPDIFLVANCLDPTVKLDGTFGLLEFYYNSLAEMQFAGRPGKEGLELPSIEIIRGNLEQSIRWLFNDYISTYGGSIATSQRSTRPRTSFNLGIAANSQRAQRLQSFLQNMGSSGYDSNDELSMYLNEPKNAELTSAGPNEIDLLAWWKKRATQYPVLSIMAREVLAVPASTVSVEQAFSSGGYMLDERRSTMHPKNLEAQVLLKDYTLAEAREQENKWEEVFTENPLSTTEAETDTDVSTETDDFDDDFDFDNM